MICSFERSVIAKDVKMLVRPVLMSILMFCTCRTIMVRRLDPEPAGQAGRALTKAG
jgi:hypothetical protein